MKKFNAGSAVIAAALWIVLPAVALAQSTPITIIHVNDTHSHLDSFGPRDATLEGTLGGLERAAGLIGLMKATEPNPLFLHAGDAFHGDFMFNGLYDAPEFAILKQLGIDAMTVGNHEFDLTPEALIGVLSSVGAAVGPIPMLSANLDTSACPYPPTPTVHCAVLPMLVKPSLTKTLAGVKVGIFGLTVPTDATMQPAPVVVSADYVGAARQQVASLKAQGANVIVLLSHLGHLADAAVVKAVPGIDVVVQGHDHLVYTAPVLLEAADGKKVPAVSAGDNYLYVGRLRLSYTPEKGVTVDAWNLLPVDASVPPVPAVAATVEYYKGELAKIYSSFGDVYKDVVGVAPFEITRKYDPAKQRRDTAMGNLLTDALRRHTGTEIALSVTGLIGEGLYAGPIVGADVFRPVSYGFDPKTRLGFGVSTFEITGSELLKGMETCLYLSALSGGDTYDLQFSGLRYKYDSSRPFFQRVDVDSIHVNGHRFEPARTYTVTTNSGIPMLLPKLGVSVRNVKPVEGAFEYTVLRDYVQALGMVDYTSEARIRDVAALPRAHR